MPLSIHVESLDGISFDINIDDRNAFVRYVKLSISKRFGLPTWQQCLFLAGSAVELLDCSALKDGNTLSLVVCSPPGGFGFARCNPLLISLGNANQNDILGCVDIAPLTSLFWSRSPRSRRAYLAESNSFEEEQGYTNAMPRNSPSDASPTYLHGAATADMNTFQSEAVTAALEMKEGGLYSFEIRIRCLVSLGLRAGIVGASDSTNLCSVYMDLSTGGLRGRGFGPADCDDAHPAGGFNPGEYCGILLDLRPGSRGQLRFFKYTAEDRDAGLGWDAEHEHGPGFQAGCAAGPCLAAVMMRSLNRGGLSIGAIDAPEDLPPPAEVNVNAISWSNSAVLID